MAGGTGSMLELLGDARVQTVLERLHAEARRESWRIVRESLDQIPRLLLGRGLAWDRIEGRLADKFICLDPGQGVLCHLLARATEARRIVEFGTSFGVSTIYLAAAVRANGGGRVIGTERVPAKAARARAHLREAGLEGYVEILEGDALETLARVEEPVDFLLNDGFPRFALPVLQLMADRLRPGAIVVADNVGAFPAEHRDYVAWVRDPDNGFVSSRLPLNEGTELSVRAAALPAPADRP